MILYHFPTSPFARRVRLTLALKGLSAELRDARAVPAHRDDVHRLNPLHTVPVLVDDEHVILDSNAICQYLDRKVPTPPLWPAGAAGAEAFELAALTDGAINVLSDLGMRYYSLHGDPNFQAVRGEMVGRVQRALDLLAKKVTAKGLAGVPLCGDRWSAADIAVYTTVSWLEGLPRRAALFAPAAQVVGLGWSLPGDLSSWADQHRQREDVVALG
jgi:glutathione S-transferase